MVWVCLTAVLARQLFTENLRFHQDFLLESRRVASTRESLHQALKEQAKLHADLGTERAKSRRLEKENKVCVFCCNQNPKELTCALVQKYKRDRKSTRLNFRH